jgi:hypothetical protein
MENKTSFLPVIAFVTLSSLIITAIVLVAILRPFPDDQTLYGTVIAKSWGVSSGDTVVTVGDDFEHRSIAFPNSESICNLEIGKTYKISYHYQWNKTYLDGYEEIEESPCEEGTGG